MDELAAWWRWAARGDGTVLLVSGLGVLFWIGAFVLGRRLGSKAKVEGSVDVPSRRFPRPSEDQGHGGGQEAAEELAETTVWRFEPGSAPSSPELEDNEKTVVHAAGDLIRACSPAVDRTPTRRVPRPPPIPARAKTRRKAGTGPEAGAFQATSIQQLMPGTLKLIEESCKDATVAHADANGGTNEGAS